MRAGYKNYDPNGIGAVNGNFLGLPQVDDPAITFIAIPFAPTVSYGEGTEGGPQNILTASTQLDVCIPELERPWELGFSWEELRCFSESEHTALRDIVTGIQDKLEQQETLTQQDLAGIQQVNEAGAQLATQLASKVRGLNAQNVFPVIIGGSHAVPLGAYRSQEDFGILQLDAHMDLRKAYEGFTYSHASIMYNFLDGRENLKLVQVGIRDYCPEEQQLAEMLGKRVTVFTDAYIQQAKLSGEAFAKTAQQIIAALPDRVWVSIDIDGLDPSLCANTGTPVPGGLSFNEALYLCRATVDSGRTILGMDVVEVAPAPHEYEGAVAARLAYQVSCYAVLKARERGKVSKKKVS